MILAEAYKRVLPQSSFSFTCKAEKSKKFRNPAKSFFPQSRLNVVLFILVV